MARMPPRTAHHAIPIRRAARATTAAGALVTALALTACTGGTPPTPDASTTAPPAVELSAPQAEPSSDPTPSGTPSPEATEPAAPEEPTDSPTYPPFDDHTDRALQTIAAMEATLGAGAYKIEGDDDGTEWKLELVQGDDRLKVKAEADATGVAPKDTKRDDLDDDDRDALGRAQISLSEAIARVVESSGGVLDKADLEEDDGAAYWEVTVRTGDDDADYHVDLVTGAVERED